jgi:homoserine kinase type II
MSEPERAWSVVLARYGAAVGGLRWVALGSGGGFSGAHVWRGEDDRGPVLALKAWPPGGITQEHLAAIHRLMTRAVHLPFVPVVIPASDGSTVVVAGGWVWDLCRWMPGTAGFHADPTPARLVNACAALARLHRAWRPAVPAWGPCPAVRRRLELLGRWRALSASRPAPAPQQHPTLDAPLRRAWQVVAATADRAERSLQEADARAVPVQPCLCDVWGGHVLFSGDAVGGVIDYGAVKDDHVAVDLARLLGDLVEDDEGRFAAGLDAYRAAGGELDVPDGFVRLLDRTGAVCGAINWLVRLCDGGYEPPDPGAVAARIDRLAARAQAWR